jgi:B-cell receptor-associated protein 31
MLLVAEMTLFMLLIVPLPFTIRRKMFTFISESPIIAKLQYGLKITFICKSSWLSQESRAAGTYSLLTPNLRAVPSLFMNGAVNADSKSRSSNVLGHERMEVQARKFYSQRNMYLCGFTLFLSLILNRTYTMILDVLRLEEKVKQYEGDPKAGGKQGDKLSEAGNIGEIAKLRKELERKDKNLEALKRQSEGLSREYDSLGEKFEVKDGTPKKDR